MRFHHHFDAYTTDVPELLAGSLFSLKRERIQIGLMLTVMVDAVFLDGDRIVSVPFIRPHDSGGIAVNRRHATLGNATLRWLEGQVMTWLQGVDLDEVAMTVFTPEESLTELVRGHAMQHAFPGLSPHARLLTDGERYANAAAWVRGLRTIDHTPGFRYGVTTLSQIAADVAHAREAVVAGGERLTGVAPIVDDYDAQVVMRLGVDPSGVEHEYATLRERYPHARILISAHGDSGREALANASEIVVKMSRPGAENLGALDEHLAVFDVRSRRVALSNGAQSGAPANAASRPLRVLFAVRPSAERLFGGDVVQIRETVAALQRRGHHVDVTYAIAPDANGYDIVHLSNLTTPETWDQSQAVAGFDGAVVMMPIFTDHADETAWGMQATLKAFSNSEDDEALVEALAKVADRTMPVNRYPAPPQRADMVKGYTQMQKEMLQNVDFLIANAHSEVHRIYRYLDYRIPYAVAPSAANPAMYGTFARDAFVEKYGVEDFVLVAGRYEPRKGQLSMFELSATLGLPLVCIGSSNEVGMSWLVRAYRPRNVVFLPHMPETELAGAFAAARVLVMPSWDEVVSLTSLNGALSETSLVLTRNSSEHEYFGADAWYCDPGDIYSIRDAVTQAWETHEQRAEIRHALAERVRREYNWERSAEATEAAYYRVLADNPRRAQRLTRVANVSR